MWINFFWWHVFVYFWFAKLRINLTFWFATGRNWVTNCDANPHKYTPAPMPPCRLHPWPKHWPLGIEMLTSSPARWSLASATFCSVSRSASVRWSKLVGLSTTRCPLVSHQVLELCSITALQWPTINQLHYLPHLQKRLTGALVSISDWMFGSVPVEQVLNYTYVLIRIQSETLKVGIRVRVRSKD